MDTKENIKEILIIILASIVLALTVAFKNTNIFYAAAISFLIILTINVLVKKSVGYYLETKVRTKFWSLYQFGFRKDTHFKKPLPMLWLPLILTLFTKGFFFWLGVLEFDVEAKTERVSRRHGLYRFTEVTEWHMAWIALWALIANLAVAVAAYIAGFELFTRLSIYFIVWSTIPLSNLDGSKIFFSSRTLWAVTFAAAILTFFWALTII
ncbi:MAG: hypothetical protein V1889_00685 [archaeon]